MPARDIETIYADCSRMVYWAAYGVTKNEHDAMDAMQNVFLRTMNHLGTLANMNDAQLKGWLYRVTVNICTDALRKRKHEVLTGEDAEVLSESVYDMPEAAAIAGEDKRRVREAIDTLPDIYREAVLLHYFSGCDYKQIAQMTGTTEGNIKSRMSRAKQRLYAVLKKEGGENDGESIR
ncbi:MAG: RNA polymerase sigma factor [Christensenellaceae bacterium]|nr:RNA polymerase sigma factor [Christensenellaceae bacterium]